MKFDTWIIYNLSVYISSRGFLNDFRVENQNSLKTAKNRKVLIVHSTSLFPLSLSLCKLTDQGHIHIALLVFFPDCRSYCKQSWFWLVLLNLLSLWHCTTGCLPVIYDKEHFLQFKHVHRNRHTRIYIQKFLPNIKIYK